ncbi:hypothetical protein BASA81_002615 [Batrachochytrium salamandrivorans]|nr:hypothetical protein BASA81_002615 [Batrachochytrium salamandrivorans]
MPSGRCPSSTMFVAVVTFLLVVLGVARPAQAQAQYQYCSSGMSVVQFPQAGLVTLSTMDAGYYANSLKRCWVVVPTQDQYITIDFQRISTEPKFDVVEVRTITWYDETDRSVEGASATPLTSLSGSWSLEALGASGGQNFARGVLGQAMLITLTTDENFNSYYGFQAKISATWRDCFNSMQVLRPILGQPANAMQISDGEAEYLPGTAMCFIIIPPRVDAFVQLSFTVLSTEAKYDIVDVAKIGSFDATQKRYYDRTLVFAELSGLLPVFPTIVRGGVGDIILVRFNSDFSIQSLGFAAQVTAGVLATPMPTMAPTRLDCDTGIVPYDMSGEDAVQINFQEPDVMKSNQLCFTFVPELGGKVSLKITEFDMGPNDYIRVLGVNRNANLVTALGSNTVRGIKRISVESVDYNKVFVSNLNEVLVAYVVTEGSGLIQEFRTLVVNLPGGTNRPTLLPTKKPTQESSRPTTRPTKRPTIRPTKKPTRQPTTRPTKKPTRSPTKKPTKTPTVRPTKKPTRSPTKKPTKKNT